MYYYSIFILVINKNIFNKEFNINKYKFNILIIKN